MNAPRPNPPAPAEALRRALPALRGLAARLVGAWALVGVVSGLWAGGADVTHAAPAIPARLDLGAARVEIVAPIAGQYVALCQEAVGPTLRGPWALRAGDVASVPLHALGVPCWVQVAEVEAVLAVWETPKYTVWRQWLPGVSR